MAQGVNFFQKFWVQFSDVRKFYFGTGVNIDLYATAVSVEFEIGYSTETTFFTFCHLCS